MKCLLWNLAIKEGGVGRQLFKYSSGVYKPMRRDWVELSTNKRSPTTNHKRPYSSQSGDRKMSDLNTIG